MRTYSLHHTRNTPHAINDALTTLLIYEETQRKEPQLTLLLANVRGLRLYQTFVYLVHLNPLLCTGTRNSN